jgi:hypothetical protein
MAIIINSLASSKVARMQHKSCVNSLSIKLMGKSNFSAFEFSCKIGRKFEGHKMRLYRCDKGQMKIQFIKFSLHAISPLAFSFSNWQFKITFQFSFPSHLKSHFGFYCEMFITCEHKNQKRS